jgi:hypothetical protein
MRIFGCGIKWPDGEGWGETCYNSVEAATIALWDMIEDVDLERYRECTCFVSRGSEIMFEQPVDVMRGHLSRVMVPFREHLQSTLDQGVCTRPD